mmetsp:Transcript_57384/g.174772  ORF Transcript_57384/g.174772 Transcript_57384/m.174772 type:complete len:212 (+) Transcript_57384:142-777(+)
MERAHPHSHPARGVFRGVQNVPRPVLRHEKHRLRQVAVVQVRHAGFHRARVQVLPVDQPRPAPPAGVAEESPRHVVLARLRCLQGAESKAREGLLQAQKDDNAPRGGATCDWCDCSQGGRGRQGAAAGRPGQAQGQRRAAAARLRAAAARPRAPADLAAGEGGADARVDAGAFRAERGSAPRHRARHRRGDRQGAGHPARAPERLEGRARP